MIFKLTVIKRDQMYALAVEDEQGEVTRISAYRLDTEDSARRWAARMLLRRPEEVEQMMTEKGLIGEIRPHPKVVQAYTGIPVPS